MASYTYYRHEVNLSVFLCQGNVNLFRVLDTEASESEFLSQFEFLLRRNML